MHEASLMTNLMDRIKAIAEAESAQRVTSVSVWLGALSHMSEAHFIEHFEHAAAGTIAQAAKLNITLSKDTAHVNAQDIILEDIEIET